jgi:hypothetical protein
MNIDCHCWCTVVIVIRVEREINLRAFLNTWHAALNHRLQIRMCVKKMAIVGTEHYFKRIKGFATWESLVGINLIPVTVCQ